MLLIDDRTPPRPERPVWEPDWRLVAWIAAAIGFGVAAASTGGMLSFGLLCATVACASHAVTIALPWGDGLREYRQ